MNVLITGGAGYIGSYITSKMIAENNVIIVDNLSTGHIDGVHPDAIFCKGDIRDEDFLESVFSEHDIDVVIHMAALISVAESIEKSLEYYEVNTEGTLKILKVMKKYNVDKIVFSSTAAVYGEPTVNIIEESCETLPINPYGKSKLYAEEMIQDFAIGDEFNFIIFRYFNVAGGSKPGYDLSYMSSLIPKTLCSVRDNGKLYINGNDYDTKDGTCVRDYIHILDLADAHILAAEALYKENDCSGVYNLGNGKGYTILEVVETTKKVLNTEVSYEFVERREGDPVYSVASSQKSNNVLNWKPNYPELDKIIKHMWESNTSEVK